VDRGEEHVGAVVEDVLGAVAVVVVDVEDGHPRGAWSSTAWAAMAALLKKQ
jgi:hypothetical protein